MAKPESWRRETASYPLSITANTRFQDLDVNGHLNNVAFAALFENARVRLNRAARPWDTRPENERTMVAAVTINYLAEGNFPDDIVITSGIGSIGSSSWTILQAMFQNDICIATCDTVVVCRTGGEAKPLRAEIREYLERILAPAPGL